MKVRNFRGILVMIINYFQFSKEQEIFNKKVDIKSLDTVENIVYKYTNYIEWERNQNVIFGITLLIPSIAL